MIVNERIVSYIHSLEKSNSMVLEEIEKEAIATYVPIIRKEMESFLRVMLTMKQPKRILELGTAIGYSAILMSEYLPEGGHIRPHPHKHFLSLPQSHVLPPMKKDCL